LVLARWTILPGLVLAAVVALVGAYWLLQRRLIYVPMGPPPPAAASIASRAEDVTLRTEDGLELGGWFVPAEGQCLATALVLNGNAGNRADRLALALDLARQGFDVMLFDYRGYGGNPGTPSEDGLIRDALAAVRYLAARDRTDPTRLVYFGESLGAAVAVALALERPPAVLVLRSPFTSMTEVGRYHYPFLPVRLMLRDRWPSIDRVRQVRSPLLVIAGTDDRIVPYAQSQALFDAAPGPVKRFIAVDGAGHNDAGLAAGERLSAQVARFVIEVLDGKPAAASTEEGS
jgi:fermentation-respiration switch protein FrsA (DUF1100 family)